MAKQFTFIVLAVLTLLLSGCVTNYQYLTRGEVKLTDGDTRKAVLYWHKDEGRLWYGKKYEQLDTSLTMRICRQLPKLFDLGKAGYLVLHSKAGDVRVATVADNGELEPLATGQPLPDGDNCGVIQVGGVKVGTGGLRLGLQPTVTILCQNTMRPDRYPAVARYEFRAITRSETDAERSAPDPCIGFN
jgi:hypothetical protein